jgi:hypothetical protein
MSTRIEYGVRRLRTAVVGRVFLAYWFRTPDVESVRAAVSDLHRARLTLGERLLCCAYVPEWVAPPPSDVRRVIIELTPEMLGDCESIHTVHEGDGILPTAFRTVAWGMVLAGGYRGKVFVHSSLDEFLSSCRDSLGASPSEVRREFERLAPGSVLLAH